MVVAMTDVFAIEPPGFLMEAIVKVSTVVYKAVALWKPSVIVTVLVEVLKEQVNVFWALLLLENPVI